MKVLGTKVFLSEAAVRKRVRKLENVGYIKGYHAILDKKDFTKVITGNNHIKLNENGGGNIERFMQKCLEIPEIQNCQHVAAKDHDFIVIIETTNLIEHNRILLLKLCPSFDINIISTSFVLSETKGFTLMDFTALIKNGLNKLLVYMASFSPLIGIQAISTYEVVLIIG